MHESEPAPVSTEIPLARKSDRVDTPQQYGSWRDYAFSDDADRDRKKLS